MTLALTGSTGRLGGRVARRLAAAGAAPRLVVRDPSRAPRLPDTVVTVATYGDRPASLAALSGVDVLFMVSGSEEPDRVGHHKAFVDVAAEAGVRHIVYTSFSGAAPNATFTLGRDHWATEEHIRASGMAYTFLRDNIYLDFFPFFVGDDDVIRGPAGDGRAAAVAQDDIADAAAVVLTDPDAHAGQAYEMTGGTAISMAEAAAAIAAATGRPVRYHEETVEEAYASRARYGAQRWQLDAWVSTYTAMAAGDLAHVSDDVRRLTGHRPLTMEEVLGRG
ncbi:MAG TPA: NmrA family NAD(P)-binding protein [Asanoa sp.]